MASQCSLAQHRHYFITSRLDLTYVASATSNTTLVMVPPVKREFDPYSLLTGSLLS